MWVSVSRHLPSSPPTICQLQLDQKNISTSMKTRHPGKRRTIDCLDFLLGNLLVLALRYTITEENQPFWRRVPPGVHHHRPPNIILEVLDNFESRFLNACQRNVASGVNVVREGDAGDRRFLLTGARVPNICAWVMVIQHSSRNHYHECLTHNHEWFFLELVHNRRIGNRVAASETSIQPEEKK